MGRLSRSWVLWSMLAGAALAAPPPLPAPERLSGGFSGVLPCADCPGIRYRLELLADRAFVLESVYLDRNEDRPLFDLGSWDLSSDGRILVLAGGREAPRRFLIDGTDRLTLLDLEGRQIESSLDYSLRRDDSWRPLVPRLAMRGRYRYLADAGLFTECLSGLRWPVAQVADNRALERAYLDARAAPRADLLVSLEGAVEPRPAMEGDALVPSLVVDRFIAAWPGENCAPRFRTVPLVDTRWRLTWIEGRAITPPASGRDAHLVFGDDGRLAGSGGCNRVFGGYRVDGARIDVGPLAGTRMACPTGMDLDDALGAALHKAVTWNVIGPLLEIYDPQQQLVARFAAQAPGPAAAPRP